MSSSVLDASALLALILAEPGNARVVAAVTIGAAVSTVNIAEVVGKLLDYGMTPAQTQVELAAIELEVEPFTEAAALSTGYLRPATRHLGLSLGDRACLALAASLGVPALTADRPWANLNIGVDIEVIR